MPRLHFQLLDPEPAEIDIIEKYQGFPIVAVVHVLEGLGQTKIRCANKEIQKKLGWHFSNSHVLRKRDFQGSITYDCFKVVKPHTVDALRANQGFVMVYGMKFFAHYEEDEE